MWRRVSSVSVAAIFRCKTTTPKGAIIKRRNKMEYELKCPKCGSSEINQYGMPTGRMWCIMCNFSINNKELNDNPFKKNNLQEK
jgi:predicted RNA-binding Zn-ribbon protein involved in translation (DUF1610 family)